MKNFKIEIKSISGKVLFTYESEKESTIREAVEQAVRESANLRYANLSYANLSSADLSYANLSYANLRYANLSSADLSSADLSYANLSSADLSYANLSYADLSYANLSSANLSSANLRSANLSYAIKIPMYCRWDHGITEGMIDIGCEKRSVEDWDKFFTSNDVIETERNTPEFKQIEAIYLAYKAYLNHLQ